MTERYIEISKSLWLVIDDVHPDYDDGLFTIRDDTGGNTLVDREEIPTLIEGLASLMETPKGKRDEETL